MFRLVLTTAVLFACSAGELTFAQQGGDPKVSGALSRPTVPADFAAGDKDVDQRVGRLVDIFATKGPFSGIVAVAREGKVIAAHVAGSADIEHGAHHAAGHADANRVGHQDVHRDGGAAAARRWAGGVGCTDYEIFARCASGMVQSDRATTAVASLRPRRLLKRARL